MMPPPPPKWATELAFQTPTGARTCLFEGRGGGLQRASHIFSRTRLTSLSQKHTDVNWTGVYPGGRKRHGKDLKAAWNTFCGPDWRRTREQAHKDLATTIQPIRTRNRCKSGKLVPGLEGSLPCWRMGKLVCLRRFTICFFFSKQRPCAVAREEHMRRTEWKIPEGKRMPLQSPVEHRSHPPS